MLQAALLHLARCSLLPLENLVLLAPESSLPNCLHRRAATASALRDVTEASVDAKTPRRDQPATPPVSTSGGHDQAGPLPRTTRPGKPSPTTAPLGGRRLASSRRVRRRHAHHAPSMRRRTHADCSACRMQVPAFSANTSSARRSSVSNWRFGVRLAAFNTPTSWPRT